MNKQFRQKLIKILDKVMFREMMPETAYDEIVRLIKKYYGKKKKEKN